MSLVACHLEANGIPTVVIGSARDVVERCGAPRFLFNDFPLGNPCGRPYDTAMQDDIASRALALLEEAESAKTTRVTPLRFSDDDAWRSRFLATDAHTSEELQRMGERRRAARGQPSP